MMPIEINPQPDQTVIAKRRRRQRSIALGVALAVLVAIIYLMTFVKMGMYHHL